MKRGAGVQAAMMCVRAAFRSRWKTWLGLAILIGAFGGAVIAASVGARRTDSVVARHIVKFKTPDIFMVPAFSANGELLDYSRIAAFDEVVESLRLQSFGNQEGLDMAGSDSGTSFLTRSRLIHGRMPRPDEPREALANILAFERKGIKVGDAVTVHLGAPGSGDASEAKPGPTATVRIVGITASLGDFVDVAAPGITVTGAFVREFRERASSIDLLVFRLRHGEADLGTFRSHISAMTGGKPVLFVEASNDWRQVQGSFHVAAVALWFLAGFLALSMLLLFGQTLVRLTIQESGDDAGLRAIGATRRSLTTVHGARSVLMGAAAALASIGVAYGLSALTPFGRSGLAEPSPGFVLELRPVLAGAVALLVFVTLVGTGASFRGVRTAQRRRTSDLSNRIGDIVPGAPARLGVTLALEPGRGRSAVPVKSTIAACALGVVAIVTALTVWTSLEHLLKTPRAYGWNWDIAVAGEWSDPAKSAAIRDLPGVAGVSFGEISGQVVIDGINASLMQMAPGPVAPVILEGRLPRTTSEAAVGRKTLREARLHIGDSATIVLQGTTKKAVMRIVGVVVLPFASDTSGLGDGAFLTHEAVRRSFIAELPAVGSVAFVRFTPGADAAGLITKLRMMAGSPDSTRLPTQPGTVADFGRVRSMPLLLAGVVALMSLATISHLLISSVRRRRRDLAVIKTLGFVRGQVRAAVAWQATTIALISIAIGLPLGIIAGRWTWIVFARYGGFLDQTVVSGINLLVAAVSTVLLANIIAAVPATYAAKTRPALVLRAE